MGCDIHLYVETRKNEHTPWEWLKSLPARECGWCSGKGHYEGRPNDACYNCKGSGVNTKPFHERSYNTFAILANVRNGSGFAGVKTGDGFNFISEPRGLPKDLSVGLRKAAAIAEVDEDGQPVSCREVDDSYDDENYEGTGTYRPWLGDHSYTHMTLDEVMAFDWEQGTKECGLVTAAVYADWVEKGRKGRPESWCGGVSGPGVTIVSNKEMDQLIAEGKVSTSLTKVSTIGTHYTSIEWGMGYRDAVSHDWWSFLESLMSLGIEPSNIRLVMGFDS